MTTNPAQDQSNTKAAINKQILELKKKIQLSGNLRPHCNQSKYFKERLHLLFDRFCIDAFELKRILL